jgi:hypothetical protein
MKSFIIRGDIQSNGQVMFNVKDLNFQQRQFVQSCQVQLNSQPRKIQVTNTNSLALVMYRNKEDFAAMLLQDVKGTPDLAWQEYLDMFNNASNSSSGITIGKTYTRSEIVRVGTEQAGMIYDHLKEGGRWPWANAGIVLEKQGAKLVVVDTI